MRTCRFIQAKNTLSPDKQRSTTGSSLLELAAVVAFMPLATLICVNLGVVVFAAGINDSACKDAARAAGQRANLQDALDAADAIVGRYSAGGIFGKPQVVKDACTFELQPDQEGNPQIGGTPGLPGGPYVTIATKSVVQLPAPLVFNGVSLTDKMTIGATYTFPILNPGRINDDDEITVGNGPDNDANAASAEEERLALVAEAASEKAAIASAIAENASAAAASAASTAATLDAQSLSAAAAAAAAPANSDLAAAAKAAAAAAAAADAASSAAAAEADKANAAAAAAAEAEKIADQNLDAASLAIETAYGASPEEIKAPVQSAASGDINAGTVM